MLIAEPIIWTFCSVTLILLGIFSWSYHRNIQWFLVYLTHKNRGPSPWKLIRIAKRLLSDDFLNCMSELSAYYDYKPYSAWFHGDFVTVVSDCESISEIFKSKHLTDKPDAFYGAFKEFIGEGLVNLNGAEHRRHRKILAPSFRKKVLESQLPHVNRETVKHVDFLREKADGECFDMCSLVEVQSLIMSFIFVFSRTDMFPIIQNVSLMFNTTLVLIHERAINPIGYWFSMSRRKTASEIKSQLADYKKLILEQKRSADLRLRTEDGTPGNHLELLCRKDFEGGEYFNEQEYIDETKTLLAAGAETTSCTQKACLLLLALFPEEQRRVFEEIHAVFGESDRPAEVEDLARLEYLEMVIKEALRLFPPTPVLARLANQDIHIGGVFVPKGSFVAMNLYALHRDPSVFKDPLKFDPERFSVEECEKRHPFAYIPFSMGARNCPGQQQAFMMMKTYLSHVLRNFEILPGEDLPKSLKDLKITMHFVLHLPQFSVRLVSRKPVV